MSNWLKETAVHEIVVGNSTGDATQIEARLDVDTGQNSPLTARPDIETYSAHVSGAWNIGQNPNGGYLTSLALRAMAAAVAKRSEHLQDPISITTHFLRPGQAGVDAEIDVEVVRVGRSVATVRCLLTQNGKACLTVLGMFADLSEQVGIEQEISIPMPQIAAVDQCEQRSGANQGVTLPLMDRLDVMLDPSCTQPGASELACVKGWIRMADGSDPHSGCLPLFCDAFPPSVFPRLGVVGWVPTLELTVHVRRRPQPGWVCGQFMTEDLTGGRMIETGALWDESGALVAQSRQIGIVMRAD